MYSGMLIDIENRAGEYIHIYTEKEREERGELVVTVSWLDFVVTFVAMGEPLEKERLSIIVASQQQREIAARDLVCR